MDTKKRLSEWTLAECKEYCDSRQYIGACDDCKLHYVICESDVRSWKFDNLTDGEKAIMRACGAKWVTMNRAGDVYITLWDEKPTNTTGHYDGGGCIGTLDSNLFPSVSGGDCIELED